MEQKHFENNMVKGENDGNQHFLLFPYGFQPFSLSPASGLNLEKCNILSYGVESNHSYRKEYTTCHTVKCLNLILNRRLNSERPLDQSIC